MDRWPIKIGDNCKMSPWASVTMLDYFPTLTFSSKQSVTQPNQTDFRLRKQANNLASCIFCMVQPRKLKSGCFLVYLFIFYPIPTKNMALQESSTQVKVAVTFKTGANSLLQDEQKNKKSYEGNKHNDNTEGNNPHFFE